MCNPYEQFVEENWILRKQCILDTIDDLVSSFGAQVCTPKRFAITTISIHTLNAGKIPVSVLAVPKLAAPIRNFTHICLRQLPYTSVDLLWLIQ